jgi:hypothetical protein
MGVFDQKEARRATPGRGVMDSCTVFAYGIR